MKKKIYVQLLEEGSPTIKGTGALDKRNGQYEILRSEDYDREDEIWGENITDSRKDRIKKAA